MEAFYEALKADGPDAGRLIYAAFFKMNKEEKKEALKKEGVLNTMLDHKVTREYLIQRRILYHLYNEDAMYEFDRPEILRYVLESEAGDTATCMSDDYWELTNICRQLLRRVRYLENKHNEEPMPYEEMRPSHPCINNKAFSNASMWNISKCDCNDAICYLYRVVYTDNIAEFLRLKTEQRHRFVANFLIITVIACMGKSRQIIDEISRMVDAKEVDKIHTVVSNVCIEKAPYDLAVKICKWFDTSNLPSLLKPAVIHKRHNILKYLYEENQAKPEIYQIMIDNINEHSVSQDDKEDLIDYVDRITGRKHDDNV